MGREREGIVRSGVGLSHVGEPTGLAEYQVAQFHASGALFSN